MGSVRTRVGRGGRDCRVANSPDRSGRNGTGLRLPLPRLPLHSHPPSHLPVALQGETQRERKQRVSLFRLLLHLPLLRLCICLDIFFLLSLACFFRQETKTSIKQNVIASPARYLNLVERKREKESDKGKRGRTAAKISKKEG